MPRITEELIRKSVEHNDGEIGTLEEVTFHQRDLEKLEHIQHWCRHLKILLLHQNLIPKIENLHKLKELEYLNLSLNNIKKIENLERCESLKKLDLTLNFIGELTSVESLKNNIFLEALYLMGNPCVDFEDYRNYVIATLPQLKTLDGYEILPSERIKAIAKLEESTRNVLRDQKKYLSSEGAQILEEGQPDVESDTEITDEQNDAFWKSTSKDSPTTRVEMVKHSQRAVEERLKRFEIKSKMKPPPKYFKDDGTPFNMNVPKLKFQFYPDGEEYLLDLAVYKHLDTALLDVDVQPHYVRVMVKGKPFQIHLKEEVKPDSSVAKRAQSTGHLQITMPKVKFDRSGQKYHEIIKQQSAEARKQKELEQQLAKINNNESDIPPLEDFEEYNF